MKKITLILFTGLFALLCSPQVFGQDNDNRRDNGTHQINKEAPRVNVDLNNKQAFMAEMRELPQASQDYISETFSTMTVGQKNAFITVAKAHKKNVQPPYTTIEGKKQWIRDNMGEEALQEYLRESKN